MTRRAPTASAARDRQALLRRETIISAVVNTAMSVGFFLLVFGWAPAATWAVALDCLAQTVGITFLGGLVPSFIMLARIRKGVVIPAGPVPSARGQAARVLVCALIAMPLLGGAAAALMMVFAPPVLPPLPALIVKAIYGGVVGIVTTPPILRLALGMSVWPGAARRVELS